MSIDQIITGMQASERRWLSQPSWLVEYEHSREYVLVPAGASKSWPARQLVYARRGADTYLHEYTNSEMDGQTWSVWKDEVCVTVTGDALTILPEPVSALFEMTFYTNALYLDIYKDYEFVSQDWKDIYGAQSPSEAFFLALPRAIEQHRQAFTLRGELEEVDGVLCHVLERNGRDIIWIDTAHGYICRRRTYFQESGAKFHEQTNEDLAEHLPGLWLPRRQVQQRYFRADAPEELREQLNSIETNRLIRVQFGDVPESLFAVPLSDRMLVTDKIRGKRYISHPKGTEAADALSAAIERATREMASPIESGHRGRLTVVILVNVIGLLAALFAYQVWWRSR